MNWTTWALLSALFGGITAILAKIGVAGIDSNLATAIRTVVILVFSWAIVLATRSAATMGTISSRTWVFLCLSGVATGCSWLCYFRALQMAPASKVAPLDKLSVLFAIALAAIFLREKIGWQQVCGGALIIAGAFLVSR